MIKKIITISAIFFTFVSLAQQNTASPYSYYGIGDVKYRGTLESRSMAGIALENDSIHVNFQNPASYANLKLATLTMGATTGFTTLESGTEKAKAVRTGVDYVGLGLPMGRFGLGMALVPYSAVGYKIQSTNNDIKKTFEGSGGMNKAGIGLGYKIATNTSFGADVQYNFGKIRTQHFEFPNYVSNGSMEESYNFLSGFNFNLGLMQQVKLNKKQTFFSSINYTFKSNLKSENNYTLSTISSINQNIIETSPVLTIANNLKMPSRLTLGAGVGEARKWFVGAEIALSNAIVYQKNDISLNNNITYGNYTRYSLGGYYIPNYNSYLSYAKRINYRAGVRIEKTGLIVNNQSINDQTVTLGVGLPALGSFSNFNIGVEFGQKGTKNNGLIFQKYANLSIGFSLSDKWFEQRKFN